METLEIQEMTYAAFRNNMVAGLGFLQTARGLGEQALVRRAQHDIASMCGDHPVHAQTWSIEQQAIKAVINNQ